LLTLLACLGGGAAGCTRANPAYRPAQTGGDTAVADEGPGPAVDLGGADQPLTDRRTLDGGLTAGLVAYWPLDEGAGARVVDATGFGNNGATDGGPVWASAGFPAAAFPNPAALVLDGEDDYVDIAPHNLPSVTAPKSLSVWFKATNAADLPIRNFIALINEGADAGIQLGLDHGQVAAWMFGDLAPMLAAGAAVDGNWHHAAYTYDGAAHRLYYDGRPQGSVVRAAVAAPVARVRLGTWKAPEEMFSGTLDDVRVYARALEVAEVAALAAGQ
jgi:hypothetical protein